MRATVCFGSSSAAKSGFGLTAAFGRVPGFRGRAPRAAAGAATAVTAGAAVTSPPGCAAGLISIMRVVKGRMTWRSLARRATDVLCRMNPCASSTAAVSAASILNGAPVAWSPVAVWPVVPPAVPPTVPPLVPPLVPSLVPSLVPALVPLLRVLKPQCLQPQPQTCPPPQSQTHAR